jgi:hypothetical protein
MGQEKTVGPYSNTIILTTVEMSHIKPEFKLVVTGSLNVPGWFVGAFDGNQKTSRKII